MVIRDVLTTLTATLLLATLACSDDTGDKKADLDYPCKSDGDCQSGRCYRSVCASANPLPNGTGCYTKGQCRSFKCVKGVCLQGDGKKGSACKLSEECAGNYCLWGRCQDPQRDAGPDLGRDTGPDLGKDLGKDLTRDMARDLVNDTALPDKGVPDIPTHDGGPCTSSLQCNDNLLCTTDTCVSGKCVNKLDVNYCLIKGACVPDGTSDPNNICYKCDTGKTTSAWTPNNGATCDDKEKCTYSDGCFNGKCTGVKYSCDDKLSCTDEECTGLGPGPNGCKSTLKTGYCLIGLVCYQDKDIDPNNLCHTCSATKVLYNWTPVDGKGCVTTYAGTGAAGLTDGDAEKASFNKPAGIAVDGAGNVYVADTGNHVIRLIARQSGKGGTYTIKVSTWAGGKNSGFADGAAVKAAMFSAPTDVEIDSTGKVYVADSGNHAVRVVWNDLVNTLAGTGVKGYKEGAVMAAKFNTPTGVAVDDSTAKVLVYVADSVNARIRKIDIAQGLVSTAAGTGTAGFKDGAAASAQFNAPWDVERDAKSGLLYVSDGGAAKSYLIRKLDVTSALVSSFAGDGNTGFKDGAASVAQLGDPRGLSIDTTSGLGIYVADAKNHVIRLVATPKGSTTTTVSTFAGDGNLGLLNNVAKSAKFSAPYAIAATPTGHMYIADRDNSVIRLYTP